MDNEITSNPHWTAQLKDNTNYRPNTLFDEVGDYRNITVAYYHFPSSLPQEPSDTSELEDAVDHCILSTLESQQRLVFQRVLTQLEDLRDEDEDTEQEREIVDPFQDVFGANDLEGGDDGGPRCEQPPP